MKLQSTICPVEKIQDEYGRYLNIPITDILLAAKAVDKAHKAFQKLSQCDDKTISRFFNLFKENLSKDDIWQAIMNANKRDIQTALKKKKNIERLSLDDKARIQMIEGLNYWEKTPHIIGSIRNTVQQNGFIVDEIYAGCGVIAFVFEGRPNVFADAVGIIRYGNTGVLKIGQSAEKTTLSIVKLALKPALKNAGLPEDSIVLLDAASHNTTTALMSDKRLFLAIIRGSGKTSSFLGKIARNYGIPISLHGTGGAWMIIDKTYNKKYLYQTVDNSLDRKVCNTLNTIVVLKQNAKKTISNLIQTLKSRADGSGNRFIIHYSKSSIDYFPVKKQDKKIVFKPLTVAEFSTEWEWDNSPEISLIVVADLEEAIELFNTYSPLFVASLISDKKSNHNLFFAKINAPFIGNGFTRWVDGQYIFKSPELGLSNWQIGKPLGRSSILTASDLVTIRLRMRQQKGDIKR